MVQRVDGLGQFLKRVGLVLLLVALVFLAWRAANVLLLIFFGILLAVLLSTLTGFVARRTPLGWKWSLGVVILLLLILLGGVGWLVGPRLTQQASSFNQQLTSAFDSFERSLAGSEFGRTLLQRVPILEAPAGAGAEVPGAVAEGPGVGGPEEPLGVEEGVVEPGAAELGAGLGADGEADPGETDGAAGADAGAAAGAEAGPAAGALAALPGSIFSTVFNVLTTIAQIFGDLLLVLFIGLFLAVNPQMYRDGIAMLFPRENRPRVREALTELGRTIQGWLLVQLLSMTVVAVIIWLGLTLLGVRLALVLALLAFFLEFIPYIGPWLAYAPAALIALSMGGSTIIWVTLLYLAANIIEGDVILPIFQQRTVDVPPALTLAAIFIFGALFGFVGIVVAAPLVAVIYVFVKLAYVEWTLHEDVETPAEKGISL